MSLTLLIPMAVSKAEEPTKPATLAIIDTALDTSIPAIKNRLIFEVCILDWASCPNKTPYQEGPGAAVMPLDQMQKNGFDHGTQMASAAIATNPNINIVFVRFVGATSNGSRQITNESSFINALTWVLYNKDKYNIQAVAMSQSHHNLLSGAAYCPTSSGTRNALSNLAAANIPVFLPAGNLKDMSRISWPACIPAAISVSASAYGDGPALYTNYDKNLTDFFARGDMKVYVPGGAQTNATGTSISTQVAASLYMAAKANNPTYTYTQLLEMMAAKSKPVASRSVIGKILSAGSI